MHSHKRSVCRTTIYILNKTGIISLSGMNIHTILPVCINHSVFGVLNNTAVSIHSLRISILYNDNTIVIGRSVICFRADGSTGCGHTIRISPVNNNNTGWCVVGSWLSAGLHTVRIFTINKNTFGGLISGQLFISDITDFTDRVCNRTSTDWLHSKSVVACHINNILVFTASGLNKNTDGTVFCNCQITFIKSRAVFNIHGIFTVIGFSKINISVLPIHNGSGVTVCIKGISIISININLTIISSRAISSWHTIRGGGGNINCSVIRHTTTAISSHTRRLRTGDINCIFVRNFTFSGGLHTDRICTIKGDGSLVDGTLRRCWCCSSAGCFHTDSVVAVHCDCGTVFVNDVGTFAIHTNRIIRVHRNGIVVCSAAIGGIDAIRITTGDVNDTIIPRGGNTFTLHTIRILPVDSNNTGRLVNHGGSFLRVAGTCAVSAHTDTTVV